MHDRRTQRIIDDLLEAPLFKGIGNKLGECRHFIERLEQTGTLQLSGFLIGVGDDEISCELFHEDVFLL
jgi:hypothetical protein